MADVSIVLPCLNERQALGHCVGVARQALAVLKARHGLTGEIVVADNGSCDGSQDLALSLGARLSAPPGICRTWRHPTRSGARYAQALQHDARRLCGGAWAFPGDGRCRRFL